MTFSAVKDPRDLTGKTINEIFADYHLIRSKNIESHISEIKKIVNGDVKFYSLPDAQGMRFMREMTNGDWISDFRFEAN